jgi:hypothetical protein
LHQQKWLGNFLGRTRTFTGRPTHKMSSLKIEDLFGVKGYVALVTGGSSGLGFMISKVRCFAFRGISKPI